MGDGWVVTWTRRGGGFRRGVEGRDSATDVGGVNGFFGVCQTGNTTCQALAKTETEN